jgi:hypothetical protein
MGILKIERIGGLAGFGGEKSRLKSDGEMPFAALSPADQKAVEAMFETQDNSKAGQSKMRDGFSYRVTREGEAAGKTILVPEDKMPAALIACVKDRIG